MTAFVWVTATVTAARLPFKSATSISVVPAPIAVTLNVALGPLAEDGDTVATFVFSEDATMEPL